MGKRISFIFLFLFPGLCFSQSSNIPLNPDYHSLVQRYEVLSGRLSASFHSSVKPFSRQSIGNWLNTLNQVNYNFSPADTFNLNYLARDNWTFTTTEPLPGKGLWNTFYTQPADLYSVKTNNFELHLNPVIYFGLGTEQRTGEEMPSLFINTRGAEISGLVDNKIGFYSFIGENQMRLPSWGRERIEQFNVIPNEGFWKRFNENAVDFFTARGYLSVNFTPHVNAQAGYDRFFIGDGIRSLILSNYAPAYSFVKINTKVWKLNYVNLFAEMRADSFDINNRRAEKKYMAFHHLSLNITPNINVGLFETIIFGQDPALNNGNRGFELQYLNPIIFYRAVEQQKGSPDNAVLGMNAKWNFLDRFSVYGQFVLDEFLLREIQSGNGWWANKYAWQVGIKVYNLLGIDNLDLQLERNTARPYTYTHQTRFTNYAHYQQSLAHPFGANFNEQLVVLRYQPYGRLQLQATYLHAVVGADTLNSNWGGNILLDYRTREQDFNNEIGQGVRTTINLAELRASYMLWQNLFAGITYQYRKQKSDPNATTGNVPSHVINASLRLNIPVRSTLF